nr:MAG TPA: hypothetical protein [Caudoviricetes sp.]
MLVINVTLSPYIYACIGVHGVLLYHYPLYSIYI